MMSKDVVNAVLKSLDVQRNGKISWLAVITTNPFAVEDFSMGIKSTIKLVP